MNATTSQTVESRESRAEGQPPRTDPRNSNIVPFTPPSLLDAPAGVPANVFFEQQCGHVIKDIRESLNRIAHAVEVWRRYFPGEEFPAKALDQICAESDRIDNLIRRARESVELTPPTPDHADIEGIVARQK